MRCGHAESLPPGTKVRIKISHRSESLDALGRVAFVRPNAGMGIFFTRIEPHDQLVLDKWIAELRDQYKPAVRSCMKSIEVQHR